MRKFFNIVPLILFVSLISLSSCVNEARNPAKRQDSVSQLTFSYTTPDSNNILRIALHASLTPALQKNYRLDWNFGDTTGIISWFDTNNLVHVFKNFGPHLVTLTVVDSQTKVVLRKTSMTIDIEDIPIDTNYLHKFTHMRFYFQAKCICPAEKDSMVLIDENIPIKWSGKHYVGENYLFLQGEISLNGDSILSSSYEFYSTSWWAVGYHGINTGYQIKYLEFSGLSNISKKDSMIFSNSGENLISKISSLVDTSFIFYGTTIGPYYSPQTMSNEYIISDPSPILKITFY